MSYKVSLVLKCLVSLSVHDWYVFAASRVRAAFNIRTNLQQTLLHVWTVLQPRRDVCTAVAKSFTALEITFEWPWHQLDAGIKLVSTCCHGITTWCWHQLGINLMLASSWYQVVAMANSLRNSEIRKYGSESEFQKPNRALPNYL